MVLFAGHELLTLRKFILSLFFSTCVLLLHLMSYCPTQSHKDENMCFLLKAPPSRPSICIWDSRECHIWWREEPHFILRAQISSCLHTDVDSRLLLEFLCHLFPSQLTLNTAAASWISLDLLKCLSMMFCSVLLRAGIIPIYWCSFCRQGKCLARWLVISGG